MGQLTIATPPHASPTFNVILFGEPGVGKSAVVNLIARRNLARVPSGVYGSTLQSTRHDIPVDGVDVCIFETIGLPVPMITGNDYLIALEKAHDFINKLVAAGGVHLLLFCIRATRLTATIQSNYRLFSEVVPPTKVPIALVFTGLEGEIKMEDWWTRNKTVIERYGLRNDGHACVTGVTDRTHRQDLNYAESQKTIRELLKRCCLKTSASLPPPEPRDWFLRLENVMQAFVDKNRKPTRGDLMNMLSTRLKLDSKTVKEFLDIMERGDAHPSSRDSQSRPQDAPLARIQHLDTKEEADFPKSDTTPKSRDLNAEKWNDPPRAGIAETSRTNQALDPGKRGNGPLRKRASSEVGTAQCRDPNATEEENKSWKWDDVARRWEITAGKAKAEPQRNTPAVKYVKSDAGVSMDDIRSNFPHDLTGHVTRSSKYPFASGSYGDIYRGKFNMRGKSIDVRHSFLTTEKLSSH